jgi:hypothetical protein
MGSNIDAKTVYSVVAGIFVAGAIFWAIGKLNVIRLPTW